MRVAHARQQTAPGGRNRVREKEEASMKRSVLVTLAALSGLLPLWAPPARAQFEIDPDHFESPNVEPFDKVKTHASSDVGTISLKPNRNVEAQSADLALAFP